MQRVPRKAVLWSPAQADDFITESICVCERTQTDAMLDLMPSQRKIIIYQLFYPTHREALAIEMDSDWLTDEHRVTQGLQLS